MPLPISTSFSDDVKCRRICWLRMSNNPFSSYVIGVRSKFVPHTRYPNERWFIPGYGARCIPSLCIPSQDKVLFFCLDSPFSDDFELREYQTPIGEGPAPCAHQNSGPCLHFPSPSIVCYLGRTILYEDYTAYEQLRRDIDSMAITRKQE
jgi:hypothetical protein